MEAQTPNAFTELHGFTDKDKSVNMIFKSKTALLEKKNVFVFDAVHTFIFLQNHQGTMSAGNLYVLKGFLHSRCLTLNP